MAKHRVDGLKIEGAPRTNHPFEVAIHAKIREFEGFKNNDDVRKSMQEALQAVIDEYRPTLPKDVPPMFFVFEEGVEADVIVLAMEMAPKDRFPHNCQQCTYLGTTHGFDHYHCTNGLDGDTVVARFGPVGNDFTSGLKIARGLMLERDTKPTLERGLRVSYLMAKKKGLLRDG